MTFTYAYKTSDGTRHEAAMEASSREEVFVALRAKGIKAIKVVAADGSKANGAQSAPLAGGKVERLNRWKSAIVVGITLLIISVLVLLASPRLRATLFSAVTNNNSASSSAAIPLTSPRHQIYGDPVIMGEFERGRFTDVFSRPGDCRLAWFAQPGRLMAPKELSPNRRILLTDADVANLKSVLDSDVIPVADDPREVRELKQIVNGLRAEMKAYLANGNGTIRSYWRRLHERTRQEIQIYERTAKELEHERDAAVWEQKNESLRVLGLRTIPNPNEE